MTVFSNQEIVYQKPSKDDLYYSAFLEGMIFRENCYHCAYACPSRIGDLTIGDFWGIERKKLSTTYTGKISVVLPNMEKGQALLKSCEDMLTLFRLPLEDALTPQQGNLLHPSIPHEERAAFTRNYPKCGFFGAMKRTQFGKKILSQHRAQKIKALLRRIKRVLRRIAPWLFS